MAAGKLFIFHPDEKLDEGVFGIADYESTIRFLKIRNQNRGSNMAAVKLFILYPDEIFDKEVFEDADHESV